MKPVHLLPPVLVTLLVADPTRAAEPRERSVAAVVDARHDLVFTAGARTLDCPDGPRSVVTLAAHDRDGGLRWRAYDHDREALCASGRADTRALDLALGDDGHVYLLAEADGPDNLLREHAFHATLAAPNHAFDRDSDPDEQTGRLAYFTRFDVAGEQLAGQFVGITSAEREPAQLAARRIAADRHGRVVVAGAVDRLPGAADERPGSEALGQPHGFVLVADSDLAGRASFTVIEDIVGPHAVVDLTLVDDRIDARLTGAHGLDTTLALPLRGGLHPAGVDKRPDPETQGTFGYESGISGSDPTCYCDATRTPGPAALLGLGLFVLAALPRPSRARRR